jgi:signal transduction histidine kinase
LSPTHREQFASQYSNIAQQHGQERASMTEYSLAEIVTEYRFMREILTEVLRREAAPTEAEWSVMHQSIDQAIAEAVPAFVQAQQSIRDLFIATFSHDIRGPLGNAQNFVYLLHRSTDEPQRAQLAKRAVANLRTIDHIVTEVLDVSRSQAGQKVPIEPACGDAGNLIEEIVHDLPANEAKRIVCAIEGPVAVYWDCKKVCRAVRNLIENAFKYGSPDTPVTIRVLETHGRVHVSIHNRGDSIPLEDQKALFLPFRRAPAAEKSGKSGWGLGLALTEAVARAHGGVVSVESEAAEGTTFTLDVLRDVRELQNGSAQELESHATSAQ